MTLKEMLSEDRKKALGAGLSCYKEAKESSKKEEELKKEAENIFCNKLMPLFEQIHDANPTESLLKIYIDASAEEFYVVQYTYPHSKHEWKTHDYHKEVLPQAKGVWNIVMKLAKAEGVESKHNLEFNGMGPTYVFWLNLEDTDN